MSDIIRCAMCHQDITGRPFIHRIILGCTSKYGYHESDRMELCTDCQLVIWEMTHKGWKEKQGGPKYG